MIGPHRKQYDTPVAPRGKFVRTPEQREHMSRVISERHAPTGGELNGAWKGSSASYKAFHIWAANHFDKPDHCELCLEPTNGSRLDWAMLTDTLSRERNDWGYFCRPCHRTYDAKEKE